MTPLRAQMVEDMTLAGLVPGTQAVYIQAVRHLAAHFRRPPDQLSEAEVRGYLLALRERGVARPRARELGEDSATPSRRSRILSVPTVSP